MIGDIAHVFNRGVDKRKIFNNSNDYRRFRDNLFLLNNTGGKVRTRRKLVSIYGEWRKELPERNKLVEIFKWTLMPNHFHLLLYEVVEGGILEFTKRVGNAYTKYFNIKSGERSGYLFQNRAKIVRAGDEGYLPYIPVYIDLNAADLYHGSSEDKMEFISSYQWSSLRDYFSKNGDKAIISQELFYKVFKTTPEKYKTELIGFLNREESSRVNLRG